MRRPGSFTALRNHSKGFNSCHSSKIHIRFVCQRYLCRREWGNTLRREVSNVKGLSFFQRQLGFNPSVYTRLVNNHARAQESYSTLRSTEKNLVDVDKRSEDLYPDSTQRSKDDTSVVSEIQADEDARIYERQAALEERETWQAQVDDAPQHPDYSPAVTWDGVEMVGGETEWDNGEVFQGFSPLQKFGTPEEITAATYRAIVEIFALLGAGKPLRLAKKYSVGSLLNETAEVRIVLVDSDAQGGNSSIKLEYPDEETEGIVLDRAVGNQDVEEGTRGAASSLETLNHEDEALSHMNKSGIDCNTTHHGYKIEVLRRKIANWGYSWHTISLTDPKIKLALIKRIIRITGIQIADPIIHRSNTVSALLSQITKASAPQSLFETLQMKEDLQALGNVQLLERRHTPVDKEQQIGRWKVIERELRSRDLPVLN